MTSILRCVCLLGLGLALTGCGKGNPSVDGAKYLLAAEPAGALDVLAAREKVKDGDDIVLAGRIGGSKRPMGQEAFFHVVDLSLAHCPKEEKCPTPWDYCCIDDEDRFKAMAMVKFESEPGKTITTDARQLLGVKELDLVVVRGKAQRNEAGNLVVLGEGLYVKEKYDPSKE